MRIFFAGPLTNLKNPAQTKTFYDRMSQVAKKNDFDYFWAFRSGTDPVKNPDIDPEYVYYKDLAELDNSQLMIAYVGEPTTGTGEELEYAREHNIPVYLIFEKDRQISRMIVGNPAVAGTIEFTDEHDALTQLETLLDSIKKRLM
ncbi:hypothetical protein A2154_04350 [Candidatus Gottesmanbacteria bacterium RBG_16_43_7]|uniref:Nucleoside 2-deoxyribosyltransferase n=1 Tax=Candidatus Gottesmanbacteria bacterium RBG_16_43_7 TaxID=1798373 RepID=A0A1F5ZCF1_9BACT|nr:MAG: hypothetical protein A2154_04350 [Candidatus Gottesmanbacteria bacterium RBG_16_43_7]